MTERQSHIDAPVLFVAVKYGDICDTSEVDHGDLATEVMKVTHVTHVTQVRLIIVI